LEAQIHSLLLAPALRGAPGVKRLVIVPDGILYYLPFTLLRDGSGRRVLETHDCRLAHSATVWMGLRAPKMRGKRYPLLAFGNAVYSEGHGRGTRGPAMKRSRQAGDGGSLRLENLPGTEAELREIAALAYASPADRAVHCLGGVDASEDALFGLKERDALKKYRAVHFAVHGLLDDDAPALNALVLTRPESAAKFSPEKYARYVSARGAPRRDGYLRLGEVKTLALQSELVVMSACETSLGRLSAGEGMVALPQAFLLAGARSVMASLWAVDDESTTALMGEFYRNYLMRGLPPSEALRRAQEALRAEYDDPYYWAAFMVYGK
jgi:CHAT domain-containing protein